MCSHVLPVVLIQPFDPNFWEIPSYNLPAFFERPGDHCRMQAHVIPSMYMYTCVCALKNWLWFGQLSTCFARVSHVHCKMYGGSWRLCSQNAQLKQCSTGMNRAVSACTVQLLLPRSGAAYANSKGKQLAS